MRLSSVILSLGLLGIAAQAAEKPSRSCRILFIGGNESPAKLTLFDGTSSQEVELTRMGFSPTYGIIPGDLTLTLLPKPPGTPLVIAAGAPKVALPAAITDFYLIISSDPANKVTPVKIQLINASTGTFPPGHMLWFNLTENRIVGTLGTRKLDIGANARLMADPPARGYADYHVRIHYLPPGAVRAEPLCETNWTHDPRSRTVNLIIARSGSAPRILGFSDYREPETEPETIPQ